MPLINATYVSGTLVNAGGIGQPLSPGLFVSASELTLGALGSIYTPGTWVGPSSLTVFAYEPEILPLTVGGGGQPTSNTRYWLS